MSVTLPLFPLGLVLVPGLVLPLHVFEQRYRLLVQELLELPEDDRRFGVVAIRQGREVGADGVTALHEVGCTAQLRQVEELDDGRFALVTVGGQRFQLGELDESRPFLQSTVELLPETIGDEATVLVTSVVDAYRAYLRTLSDVRGGQIELPELPTEPLLLSYLIVATIVVDLDDKQALLAAPDATARLRAELALLRRETTMLRTLMTSPAPDLTRQGYSPN